MVWVVFPNPTQLSHLEFTGAPVYQRVVGVNVPENSVKAVVDNLGVLQRGEDLPDLGVPHKPRAKQTQKRKPARKKR